MIDKQIETGRDVGPGREALERTNRDLTRKVAELEAALSRRSASPVRGAFGKLRVLQRVHARLTGLTLGKRYPSFDPQFYAAVYPELLDSGMGLLVHYARFGRHEGRVAAFAVEDYLRDGGRAFDPGKKTVLVVCHEASRTGAPILGWNLVRALGDDHNVVAVLLQGGELVDAFAADATAIAGPFKMQTVRPVLLQHLVAALDLRYGIDFAVVNSIECHPILPGLAACFIPTVSLVHEFPANVHPPGSMSGGLLMSTQVVFDAEVQRQAALDDWPGTTPQNQHVFHQGASEVPRRPLGHGEAGEEPTLARDQLYRRVRGSGDRPVVLGLGTISMRKGVDLFVSCAQAVAAKLGPDGVRFVWIGNQPKPHPEGNYCDWVAEQVKRAGLERTLIFIDPVDDLTGAYAAADLVLSPSRLDPFPNVAMDAALAGLPVVCFERANGFAEFLATDSLTRSLAVPYLDVAAASAEILRLLGDEAARQAVGRALQAKATTDFAMERYVERLRPVIADAKAVVAQERRDVDYLDRDDTFLSFLWLNPHETTSRQDAIRFHVRKAASGQEANQYCRRPALGFVPQTYAEHHPTLAALPFENPLAHWVRAGKPSGPWSHPVVVVDEATQRLPLGSLRAALHLHLHYPELSDGILDALAANAAACDLFISTTSEDKARELVRRFEAYRRGPVVVGVCPNRGRDIGPMLTSFSDVLQSYDVVGHFHGKRSLALTSVGLSTQLGVQWHEFLLQHLLGAKFPMVDIILGRFAADPGLGLMFPEDPNLTGWSLDREIGVDLANRMDPAMVVPRFIDFPIGTMFWSRPEALKPLFDLKLQWDDYPEEPVPIDGTMLHALERMLPVVCRHTGFHYETTHVPGVSR